MAFNIADILKDVSSPDTGRDQIEYIRLDLIDADPNNFYKLSDLDNLANNIALCGLQQPIRVRRNPENPERYVIVSGHRRRAAVELLAKEEPEKWQEVSCIIEQDAVSPSLQQLRLIYANANTRTLTSWEVSQQVEQVKNLLYKLKEEEGYEFPGRMRDHVAEAVGVSKTKIARLKVIRENLSPLWFERYQDNNLNESTAYALAKIPPEYQTLIFEGLAATNRLSCIYESDVARHEKRYGQIEKLNCGLDCGMPCANARAKMMKAVNVASWEAFHCDKCCAECPDLKTCKMACHKLADKVKKLKDDARAAKREEKAAQEKEERPKIRKIQELWSRFGYLRQQTGKSVQDVMHASKMYYGKSDEKKYQDHEDGYAKITVGTALPYSYNCGLSDVERLVALADLFGCSLDFMLCRTDVPQIATGSELTCKKTDPEKTGDYLLILDQGYGTRTYEKWTWDGCVWKDCVGSHDPMIDGEIIGWIPLPKEG